MRLLEYKTKGKMSPEKMISAINSAKASLLKDDYYKIIQNECKLQ